MQGASVPLVAEIHGVTYAEVVRVDFYANSAHIGTAATQPFTMTWVAGAPKTYVLTAVGRSATGARFPSPAVTVTVTAAPAASSGHNAAPVVPPPTVPAPTVPATKPPAEVPISTPAQPLPSLPAQALLQPSSLVYEGAFQLPWTDGRGNSFRYGGKGLAFNRERGTIFVGGEELWMKVAELQVPEVRNATQMDALDTAVLVQPLADPTEGKFTAIATGEYSRYGGILPYKGKLYAAVYHSYDGNGAQAASHFVSDDDLSVSGDAKGPFKVGALKTGYTSGFMAEVPQAWREALGGPALTGNCCVSIISRTSYGPAAFAFDPEDVGRVAPVPATPLVYYPQESPLAPYDPREWGLTDLTSELFNGTTQISGVVFPEGTRSVLFFGRHGTGPFCYGIACTDPAGRWQGNHAWPYVYRVWAYDAAELALAKAGQKKPWEVKPYKVWDLSLPFPFGTRGLKGAAYDPATGRIFIAQEQQDRPLIHVYRVQ